MVRTHKQLVYSLIFLMLIPSFSFLTAQDADEDAPLQINGTVTAFDGTPLAGVRIEILETDISTVTDSNGNYIISDPPKGTFTLSASLEGYEDSEIEVEFFDVSRTINLSLALEDIEYEVTIREDMPELMESSAAIGVISVKPAQLTSLPSLGEKDIFRSIQLMPGVSVSNESSSGLYVRGGTPDQNLILLDGMNIYEVNHFYGIFSAFNSNAISNVSMHKGVYGAEFGERLSSVVDMTGRSGIGNTTVIGGGASFLSANGYVDIPIGDSGSFMFAGRKSYNTFLSNQIHDAYDSSTTVGFGPGGEPGGRGTDFESEPVASFWDTNVRANFNLGSRDALIFSGYFGRDNLDNSRITELSSVDLTFSGRYQEQDEIPQSLTMDIGDLSNWGNDAGSATWIRNWSNEFTTIVTGSASNFFRDYDRTNTITEVDPDGEELAPEEMGTVENNEVRDYTVKLTSYYAPVQSHNLVFGGQATRNEIDYLFEMTRTESTIDNAWSGNLYSAFAKDIFTPYDWLTVTPGVRATYYDVTEKTYVDPRLSVVLKLNEEVSLKASGGEYHQFTNRLLRENPMEGNMYFWMMADDELIPVSKSRNLIAGLSWENSEYLFNVEYFDRKLTGLSEFASSRIRPRNDVIDLYGQFYTGDGTARGAEVLVQKKFGQHTGWATYTNSKVEYDFPDFRDTPYPASHDSRHEFKLIDSYKWRNFTFTGTWVYATGKPVTAPTGDIDEFEVERPDGETATFEQVELGDKNEFRMRSYHRLDGSASWDFLNKDGNQGRIGVSVFNAYNNDNVWRYEYQAYDGEIYTTEVNYLGFTVSAFVNFDLGLPTEENQVGPISGETEFQSYSEASEARKKQPTWDFHGTIVEIDLNSMTIDTKWGQKTLEIDGATIKGETTYPVGTPVHVYYKKGREDQLIVTMVFRVID